MTRDKYVALATASLALTRLDEAEELRKFFQGCFFLNRIYKTRRKQRNISFSQSNISQRIETRLHS